MSREQWSGFGIGILAGAIVGGALALLFAPKSGKETRAYVIDKVGTARRKVGEGIATARHKVGEKISGEDCAPAEENE